MGKEIERKFLVDLTKIDLTDIKNSSIEQGYLSKDKEKIIRIRIADEKSFITIKGKTIGISRDEYEYEIPFIDAKNLMSLCKKTILKTRYYIVYKEKLWELDIFDGDNKGLVIAELELKDENEKFERPSWLKAEVSHKAKFYNSNLIKTPYKKWKVK